MSNNPCDYPTMRELNKIKDDICRSQAGMTIKERVADTARRGEEALVRLGLADTVKRLGK